MKKWLVGILLLVLIVVISGCGDEKKRAVSSDVSVLKIGYLPITHAGPLYIDDAFQNEAYEVELVKFGSWPDLMDALNTGRIDGASVLIELAMAAKEQGIDLKAVALGHTDGNVLVSAPDVESVADLVGQSYAIPHKYSSHNLLLYEMLKKEGVAYADVHVVEMPPAEMPAALAERRIAGYVVAEPFGAQAVVLEKGKVHYHSDEIWPDSYCCVLVLRNEWIESRRDVVGAFVTDYVKAGVAAHAKDAQAYQAFEKYMKVDKEVLDLSLEWISYDALRIEEEPYEKLSTLMVEMGLTENPPTFKEFVEDTFFDEMK